MDRARAGLLQGIPDTERSVGFLIVVRKQDSVVNGRAHENALHDLQRQNRRNNRGFEGQRSDQVIAATVRMVMSVPIMLPSWVQLTVAWINVRINPT